MTINNLKPNNCFRLDNSICMPVYMVIRPMNTATKGNAVNLQTGEVVEIGDNQQLYLAMDWQWEHLGSFPNM